MGDEPTLRWLGLESLRARRIIEGSGHSNVQLARSMHPLLPGIATLNSPCGSTALRLPAEHGQMQLQRGSHSPWVTQQSAWRSRSLCVAKSWPWKGVSSESSLWRIRSKFTGSPCFFIFFSFCPTKPSAQAHASRDDGLSANATAFARSGPQLHGR